MLREQRHAFLENFLVTLFKHPRSKEVLVTHFLPLILRHSLRTVERVRTKFLFIEMALDTTARLKPGDHLVHDFVPASVGNSPACLVSVAILVHEFSTSREHLRRGAVLVFLELAQDGWHHVVEPVVNAPHGAVIPPAHDALVGELHLTVDVVPVAQPVVRPETTDGPIDTGANGIGFVVGIAEKLVNIVHDVALVGWVKLFVAQPEVKATQYYLDGFEHDSDPP